MYPVRLSKIPETADRFCDPAYYDSLAGEQELFKELPDEKQMAYIRRLTGLVWEKRGEIDELIERYARGWRIERISRTALAVLRFDEERIYVFWKGIYTYINRCDAELTAPQQSCFPEN